jgi:thymidylate kinase
VTSRQISPFLVELAGPAGAGKTTLVQALRAELPGASLIGAPSTRELAIGLAALAPWLVTARMTARGRWWTREELRSLAYLSAWRRLGHSPAPVGVHLLDHGPVFRLASLRAFGPPMVTTPAFEGLWAGLARDWGRRLDVVVWLDAPDQVLLCRISRRTQEHRIRGAGRAEAVAFLARYRTAYLTALDLVTEGGATLVELDSSSSRADHLAARLRDTVLAPGGRVAG